MIPKSIRDRSLFWLALLFIAFLASSCSSQDEAVIDLNALSPLQSNNADDILPVRVAIAAVISPQGTLESYTPLLEYLEEKLGRPVERVQGSTYSETNEILASGLADIAFVCTGAYIQGASEFGMEILVVPEINGESVYYSWVIVPVKSPINEIADLRNRVFAFTDPLSLTGWMYPNYMLLQMGERPEAFFGRTFFTYSHDQAIRAVADGYADGAAVDSLIYNYLIEREPSIAERLRIIHRSSAFGMPPVVVSPDIQPQLRLELQEILLDMSGDPDGLAALDTLGIDRFVLVEGQLYESARQVELAMPVQPTSSP